MPGPTSTSSLGTAELAELVSAVGSMPTAVDDHDGIERVRHFEQLKSAIAAAQARETAAFVASQRADQAAAGVPSERQNRGIASQIALARRISTNSAQRYVGFAMILTRELPETLAALAAGRTSEWRATLLARETIFLSLEDRAVVDREFAPRLGTMSDRAVETEVRKAAYHLDPEGSLARTRRAAADRFVSIRPAPDTMTRLSALAPVAQGVAAYAALVKAADTAKATGDPRSRGQIMTDTLIERITGQASADGVDVEVELLVSADSLFAHPADAGDAADNDTEENEADGSDVRLANSRSHDRAQQARTPVARTTNAAEAPGLITAPGLTPTPIPAGLARDLVARASTAWLRRLFIRPTSGELIAMETQHRLFTAKQRDFLRHRDQYCATPHCGAPIRHADHVIPAGRGGPTRVDHGSGQCEACNHASQAPGWRSRPLPGGGIETTTPTGHTYRRPPPRPFAPSITAPESTAAAAESTVADVCASDAELLDRIQFLQRVGRLQPAA